MPSLKQIIAEFTGIFALMFIGGGSIILNAVMGQEGGGLLQIALAHGLILAVMVSATMHISGAQFNPAVSITLALLKKQSWNTAFVFICTQLAGGLAATMLLQCTMGGIGGGEAAVDAVHLGATLPGPGIDISTSTVFILEVVATFFLMYVIMGTAVDREGVGSSSMIGGFGIGLVVTADILCIGPLTGASMNPARSFGPQVMADATNLWWVYWTAPVLGAALAGLAYEGCCCCCGRGKNGTDATT